MTDHAEPTPVLATPGFLVDARGQLALVMSSPEAIGVSVRRYNAFPEGEELSSELRAGDWITVNRESDNVYKVSHNPEGEIQATTVKHPSAQERETAQLVVEVALGIWPDWSENSYRLRYRPIPVIPLPRTLPTA